MNISTLIQEGYKLIAVSETCIREGDHIGKYVVYMGKKKDSLNDRELVFLNEDAVEILKAIYWNKDVILKI